MSTQINQLYAQLMEIVGEVPFGNSDFQNRTAIVNAEHTPARAYRHAALRIVNRINALQEAHYAQRKTAIEIQILARDAAAETDDLKRQLLELEIEQKTATAPYTAKLITDAKREIESLWPVIQSMGALTREQFESEELCHFEKKLGVKAVEVGADLFSAIQASGIENKMPDLLTLLNTMTGSGTNRPPRKLG